MATVNPTRDLPRLLSVKELAAYLSLPESTLYYWRERGRGPKGRMVGRQVRYAEADVLSWLEEQPDRKSSP